jgi:sulfate adenylyltransferase subunit 2
MRANSRWAPPPIAPRSPVVEMSLVLPLRKKRPVQERPALAPVLHHHLKALEAESIHILREVAATFRKPVLLYSIGKDSSVLLHLALKAFFPAPPPFALLHVDTTWKFREMIAFRDRRVKELGLDLIVHTNRDGVAQGIGPLSHGAALHTDLMKTQALIQALDLHGFDAAIGGARRDEEASRAKERIFSFRTGTHRWDPRNQRPELWRLYNGRIHPGESIRVFPLSNWTEMDVWQYIHEEEIPIVDLYFAKPRPMYVRGDALQPIEQAFVARPGEQPQMVRSRLRSLGCSPCTGAIRSDADTLPKIIAELLSFKSSERANRAIDYDQEGSMELKKREGYF